MERKMYAGKTADGGRLYLEVELREEQGPRQTVDHDTVEAYTELAIMGEVYYPGDRRGNPSVCGQVIDCLRSVLNGGDPAVDPDSLAELLHYWERWHLNGFNGGCRHQEKDAHVARDRVYPYWIDDWAAMSDAQTARCPVGYRYGSAWLVEPLPALVADRVRMIVPPS